jgi:hypothetical protein
MASRHGTAPRPCPHAWETDEIPGLTHQNLPDLQAPRSLEERARRSAPWSAPARRRFGAAGKDLAAAPKRCPATALHNLAAKRSFPLFVRNSDHGPSPITCLFDASALGRNDWPVDKREVVLHNSPRSRKNTEGVGGWMSRVVHGGVDRFRHRRERRKGNQWKRIGDSRHTPHATRHTPHATRHTPHATSAGRFEPAPAAGL